MGRIKSALEIALERTESVKGDKTSIDQFEAKQRGKRLANAFLEDPKKFPDEELKKLSKEQQYAVKQGMFDVFLSQVTLPAVREDMGRIEAVGRGLQFILGDSRFAAFYKQFTAAAAQYLEELDQYGEAIKRQYAPKLRQKEEELSRRLGRPVQLDPFQDPEFAAFYNQNMNALKGNYESLAAQVREQAEALYSR
ncbi:MAG: hypothetical protein LBQ14_06455 [Treponema sp.]|jgi:uncharacterized protein YukE|nr:hypothetical protein [Treponema sp.]